MTDYIIDVYSESKTRENGEKYTKTWLLDINPWIPVCVEGLMFSWEELENDNITDKPAIRVIENASLIQATDTHGYRVPVDF